jgi:hypothetical protein
LGNGLLWSSPSRAIGAEELVCVMVTVEDIVRSC